MPGIEEASRAAEVEREMYAKANTVAPAPQVYANLVGLEAAVENLPDALAAVHRKLEGVLCPTDQPKSPDPMREVPVMSNIALRLDKCEISIRVFISELFAVLDRVEL